jgi:hypothetical protein
MIFASIRARHLGFGVLCLVLAVVAGLSASVVPLVVLLVIGIAFVGRGLTMSN